jgi:hypothetical protein
MAAELQIPDFTEAERRVVAGRSELRTPSR